MQIQDPLRDIDEMIHIRVFVQVALRGLLVGGHAVSVFFIGKCSVTG